MTKKDSMDRKVIHGGWRSITSAPHDGAFVLTCRGRRAGDVLVAYFGPYHTNARGKDCWRTPVGLKVEPEFWMPLPVRPNGDDSAEKSVWCR